MDLTMFSPFLGLMGMMMKAVQSTYERTPRLAGKPKPGTVRINV